MIVCVCVCISVWFVFGVCVLRTVLVVVECINGKERKKHTHTPIAITRGARTTAKDVSFHDNTSATRSLFVQSCIAVYKPAILHRR